MGSAIFALFGSLIDGLTQALPLALAFMAGEGRTR